MRILLSIAGTILFLGFSTGIYAEYYMVYPASSVCETCHVRVPVKKHIYHDRWVSYRGVNRYSVDYYTCACVTAKCCYRYSGCCAETVIFKHRAAPRGHYVKTWIGYPSYDMRTGDDEVMVYSDMNNQY